MKLIVVLLKKTDLDERLFAKDMGPALSEMKLNVSAFTVIQETSAANVSMDSSIPRPPTPDAFQDKRTSMVLMALAIRPLLVGSTSGIVNLLIVL